MTEGEKIATIRAWRGAPVSIIVALLAAGAPLSQADLSDWTGYRDNEALAAACRLLARQGFIAPVPNGRHPLYRLAPRATPLPLAPPPIAEAATAEKPQSTPATTTATSILNLKENSSSSSADSGKTAVISEREQAALTALAAAGIGEPTRSRLAAMAHVTAALVQQHQHGKPRISTGILVLRLTNNEPPPPHPTGCICTACRGRYAAALEKYT